MALLVYKALNGLSTVSTWLIYLYYSLQDIINSDQVTKTVFTYQEPFLSQVTELLLWRELESEMLCHYMREIHQALIFLNNT